LRIVTRLCRLLLVLGVCAGALVALEARQRPAFRAGVELVSLSVTVTGSGGRYIGDLSAGDFTVLENGRPQDLVFFARASTALAVALLLDSSASMEQQLSVAQKAASDFVARLRPGDVAQIMDFDSRVQVLQPFTDDRDALERAIGSTTSGGSTSLYNALYIALRQLETLRPPEGDAIRRNVIVVLSDGEDTSSLLSFDEVLDAAKRSQSVIYTIGLGLGVEPARRTGGDAEFELRRFAQETGGRLLVAKDATNLSNVYNQIADELTSQYVLGYFSSGTQRDGWRSLSVRVGRPNLQARTRTGYYASTR